MRSSAIYERIKRLTCREFGVSINPNLFRDCAATSIAIEDPDHIEVAAVLLGHRSLKITDRYYNQASMVSAARRYHGALSKLRTEAGLADHDGPNPATAHDRVLELQAGLPRGRI